MSVVGKIECDGPAQVFGRIEGELRASDLMIGDSARIEGSVIAQNVTICGRVKGTIHAVRVKLQNGGAVEGDIFHRSLSIDEKPCLKDRRDGLKIQQTYLRVLIPQTHEKGTFRARPRHRTWTPICNAEGSERLCSGHRGCARGWPLASVGLQTPWAIL
jgi:cytoskeletal protein CcmA (bactofilin family)